MRAVSLVVIGVASALSLLPQLEMPASAPVFSDLVIHVIMHCGVAGSLMLGWPERLPRTIVIAGGLAIGLELAQHFIPGRHLHGADLLANFAGAIIGLALARLMVRRLS